MHLEGVKQWAKPRQELWSKLSDLPFLVRCIPDVAKVKEVKARSAVLTLRPGLSFVRGELSLTMEKLEESPPEAAKFRLATKSIGSSSELQADLRLEDKDGGTELRWSADIKQLGGLLKAVPKGLVQAAAQKVINDVLLSIEKNL